MNRVLFRLVCLSALALPLVAWSAGRLAVASVNLSPATVTTGGTATGTVTLDAAVSGLTRVNLSSSNSTLAAVPSSVTLGGTPRTAISTTFGVRTTAGQAGCALITARQGTTTPKSALLTVMPVATSAGAPVRVTVAGTAVGGASTSGTVTVFAQVPGTVTVQLSSSDAAVARVPNSVNVQVSATEVGHIGSANFPIQTSTVGLTACPIITARLGTNSSAALLKVTSIGG